MCKSFVAATALLAVLPLAARAAETVTVQMKSPPRAQFAGYYVAHAKRCSKDACLDVTIERVAPTSRRRRCSPRTAPT
ncbi:MAG: hypothetical protein ABI277_09930 [Burkholderiaceae bacterium]